jgi:hypothetical protein
MKHKKPILLFIVSIIIVGIITIPVLYNAYIRSIIYYIIEYDIDLSNREEIINKVENLNYTAYLNQSYNSYIPTRKTCVDNDLINLLKSIIENYTGSNPINFHYSFSGENYSKLYLTYSNNTIFSLKDQNNQTLFLKKARWKACRYLNFTQIPHVFNDTSTTALSELIFIKIILEKREFCGLACYVNYDFEQYLLLSKNLDVILISIYYDIFID